MLLTEAASERTIDHDFDQTAQHVHGKGNDCPTCYPVQKFHDADLGERVDEGNTPAYGVGWDDRPNLFAPDSPATTTGEDADAGRRHVSPAIHEFRAEQLEKENKRLTIENDAYKLHVAQMEALLHRLASHIDECAQLIAPVRKTRSEFPKAA